MGSLLESGFNPGQVLPAPQAAATSAAQVFGGTGQWLYPPGHQLAHDLGGSGVTNSTSPTGLLTGAAVLTDGFPAFAAVSDTVDILASGHLLNTGANQTFTLSLVHGSTSIMSVSTGSLGSNANGRHFQLEARVVCKVLGGAGVGAVRVVGRLWIYGTGGSATYQSVLATPSVGNDAQDTTVATNAAADMDLRATLLNATSTTSVVASLLQARAFPKNY